MRRKNRKPKIFIYHIIEAMRLRDALAKEAEKGKRFEGEIDLEIHEDCFKFVIAPSQTGADATRKSDSNPQKLPKIFFKNS